MAKRFTLALSDSSHPSGAQAERPENVLGKAYASSLRDKAKALRTSYVLSMAVRKVMADDLDALADIAEKHPEVFADVTRPGRN